MFPGSSMKLCVPINSSNQVVTMERRESNCTASFVFQEELREGRAANEIV
jgi:hypothetical protein